MSHAAPFLRENDRDRYFASLLIPEKARPAVQALYAFNADVASIRDRAREPAPGEIRLQWWADAISGDGHGAVRNNPIAAELLDAIAAYNLPAGPLLRLIEARRFDLYDDPMPDLQSFEGYAGETASVLYQLAAMILNDGNEIETGDAAGHLGVAQALLGHLRAFGLNASQGRIFLPLSLLSANGVAESEIFSGTDSEGLRAAWGQCVELAGEHLEKAAMAILKLPRVLRPAFAPIALQRLYLRQVPRQAPFAPPAEPAEWRRIAAVTLWSLRNA